MDAVSQTVPSAVTGEPCICCGAGTWQERFVAQDGGGRPAAFVQCESCGLLALDEPNQHRIDASYDEAYYGGGGTKLIQALQGARMREARRKAARIAALHPGPGRIFDVGCGEGLFVRAMLGCGWDVDANEIGAAALARAEAAAGRRLFAVDLLELPMPERAYDAVTMWQVFEHVARPLETLRAISRMLKPDGVLALSVPNAESWQARLFGPHWFHLDPPRHLRLFSPSNLGHLLRAHGFEPFLVVWNPLEFGPIGYVQSAMNAAGMRRDAFFGLLKTAGAGARVRALRSVGLIGLGALLTPPAIVMSLAEYLAARGGTFEIYARKVAGTPAVPGRK